VKNDARAIAEEDEMPKKKSALERFGRDLTAGGWTLWSALPMGGEMEVA